MCIFSDFLHFLFLRLLSAVVPSAHSFVSSVVPFAEGLGADAGRCSRLWLSCMPFGWFASAALQCRASGGTRTCRYGGFRTGAVAAFMHSGPAERSDRKSETGVFFAVCWCIMSVFANFTTVCVVCAMKTDGDILRLVWPHLVGTETFVPEGGSSLKILKAGEEDAGSGMYRSADIEADGVRRRGDVLFGAAGAEGSRSAPVLPAAAQYAVLQVVSAPAPFLYDAGGERIPQLVVSVPQRLRDAVASLRAGAGRYECGVWLGDLPAAKRISFLDRLVVERLDRKCRDVVQVLEGCGGDWAQTLYTMLFRAMGGNRNREPYIELASRATHQMVLRERSDIELVEALLLGTAGLLDGCFFDDYIKRLNDHYLYLSRKYGIRPMRAGEWVHSGIRAQNRPVTRIVQLASFVARSDFMFDSVAECRTRADVHALFDTEVSGYWATHYVPDGSGERCPRRIGPEKADLIAINAVVPVLFAYGQRTGRPLLKDAAFELLGDIPPENNSIVRGWSGMGVPVRSALDSQALLQLRNEYCARGRCTDCRVGKSIIKVGDKAFCFR